jgi:hypothetical protein
MSQSKILKEEKYLFTTFHGKNVNSRKFQKKMNHKPTLKYAILTNIVIILICIFTFWLLGMFFS